MDKNPIISYLKINLIEVIIPLTPVIYSYYISQLNLFAHLGFFEVFGIVYLVFNLIAFIGNKGNSMGYKLFHYKLIRLKDGKVHYIVNLMRVIIISGFIFFLGDINNIDYTTLIVFIFIIVPVPIKYEDQRVYSLLYRSLGVKQIQT